MSILAATASLAAAPHLRHRDRLVPAFDEDGLTLLWDAVRAARLGPSPRLAVSGAEPPAWWWAGLQATSDPAGTPVRLAETLHGPVALVGRGDPNAAARAAWSAARELGSEEASRLARARDHPGDAEHPMGAFVVASRHEAVTVERLLLPGGRVESWTRIGAGAAPSEFLAFQDAVGDYHVVLVALDDGRRTVGLWAGPQPPQDGQPVQVTLRRLFRQQGAWRHGAKFVPA